MKQNSEYQRLMDEARKQHMQNLQATSERIRGLYERAAHDLGAQAARAGDKSLTRRWALEYQKALHGRIARFEQELYGTVSDAMRASAAAPANANAGFLGAIGGIDMHLQQTFRGMFAGVPDDALRALIDGSFYRDNRGLAKRIWGVGDALQRGVEDVVQQGIARKASAKEMARDLTMFVDPKARKDWNWKRVYPRSGGPVDYSAQRLARTSINHAYWLANLKAAELNPFVEAMHWALSGAHMARQVIPFGEDVCDEYAAHEEGLGTGNFPLGGLPVPHPQCLCVQFAVVPEDMEEIGERLRKWAGGVRDARLDGWYNQYRASTPSDAAQGIQSPAKTVTPEQRIKNLGIQGRLKLDPKVNEMLADVLESLVKDYPEMQGFVQKITCRKEGHAYASANIKLEKRQLSRWLNINPDLFSSIHTAEQSYARDLQASFHPPGTTIRDALVHELGHMLHYRLSLKGAGIVDFQSVSNTDWMNFMTTYNRNARDIRRSALQGIPVQDWTAETRRELGLYADTSPSEFIAEAFALARAKPGASKMSDTVMKELDLIR